MYGAIDDTFVYNSFQPYWQRLSVELEQSNQQRAVFEKQLTDGELDSKKQSESERKQTDSRLKVR